VIIPVDNQRLAFAFDRAAGQDNKTESGDGGRIFAGSTGDGTI
jgi:hypothetical protein